VFSLLPHPIFIEKPGQPAPEVCLFVPNLEKGLSKDHEPTILHYDTLLKSHGIGYVTRVRIYPFFEISFRIRCFNCIFSMQIIPLRELRAEHNHAQFKTNLARQYDLFLVDRKIMSIVPEYLGREFFGVGQK
jgi:hypothetical protein